MRTRIFGSIVAMGTLVAPLMLAPAPAASQTPTAAANAVAPQEWTGPRTPDRQPDVQGVWDNPPGLSGSWSLENPMSGGERFSVLAGAPPPKHPSRIIDPPDGRVPYQSWAAAKHRELYDHADDPKQPEHIDTQMRCLLQAMGRSFYSGSGFRIIQFPEYVLMVFEQFQYTRTIRLGAPHIAGSAKFWLGDSVGHWEGNTLVIDTTNLNGKARLTQSGDFYSENTHVVERLTFAADRKAATYLATFEDPTVYTRPWTIAIALQPIPTQEFWEYACHEGNNSFAWPKPSEAAKTDK